MDLDLWIRLLARGRFLGLAEPLAAFRVGGRSLSAANDASIYDDQRAIVDQLAATPQLRVRPVDRAVGRLGAPSGRLRRRMLFALSARTSRRSGPRVRPGIATRQFLWIFTSTFMPGTSATLFGSAIAILTGITCVTFWKLPDVLDCGNSENTPRLRPGSPTPCR